MTLQRVSGHRDGYATTCPGDGLYAQLPDIRARAAGARRPARRRHRARAARPSCAGSAPRRSAASCASPTPARRPARRSRSSTPPPTGGVAAPIARAVCAADGSWSATVDLPATGSVRARFPGDAHARRDGVELADDPPDPADHARDDVAQVPPPAARHRVAGRSRRQPAGAASDPARPQGARPLQAPLAQAPQGPRARATCRSLRPTRAGLYRRDGEQRRRCARGRTSAYSDRRRGRRRSR